MMFLYEPPSINEYLFSVKEDLKKFIRNSFKDVRKTGIGVREAIALDSWTDAEKQQAARHEDVEDHWWDIPNEWRSSTGTALSFTDIDGFRFLLPAAMTAALDNVEGDIEGSVFFI